MSRQLAIVERELNLHTKSLQTLLAPSNMDAERFKRTILIAGERLPTLFECDLTSLVGCAITGAVLGLEPDGVLGQAYMIPFRIKGTLKAQFITGYQGYNTIAARSNFSILGEAVYEGDEFDVELGSVPMVRHRIDNRVQGGALLKVWAQGRRADGLLTTPVVLDISDIKAVMAKSPGAKRSDSPWNDRRIGFPAMATKTAKRRLKRSLPMIALSPQHQYSQFHLAATIDERHEEMGQHALLDATGTPIIDGGTSQERPTEPPPGEPAVSTERQTYVIHGREGRTKSFLSIDLWEAEIHHILVRCSSAAQAQMLKQCNEEYIRQPGRFPERLVAAVIKAIDDKIEDLT